MIPIAFFFGGARRTDQTAGRGEGIIGATTVAWDDQFKRGNIMWKVPRNIRMNDNVVVQEAEVFYLQKRIFDGKFGTQEPFIFQDPDFDMIQLRAFGDFRYRIKDPEIFINQFVGTFGAATSADVEERIKQELVKQLNVTLGKMKASGLRVVDLAGSLNDIEQGTLANAKPHFANLGMEILQLNGMNIPLPESIKAALEKMASAKVLGRANTAAYQQFAAADALRDAAANPSGGAGAGIGLGAGIGMGKECRSRWCRII